MKYISICSGIEAASVAFHGFGWTPLAFSEIEAFPSAVLAHHWPHVPNLGDMTKFAEWPEDILAECDLLVGGPPCQAFSVAGLRKSLDDDRGNITLAYVRLLNHIDEVRKRHGRPPAIAVYENVPGLLSTKDNAFGCLIGALAGCDEAPETETGKWPKAGYVCGEARRVGYRILDAQFFGVAQRRRRIFLVAVPCELVASLGDNACPSEILSLRESVRGNPPSRSKAWEGVARSTAASLTSSGQGVGRPGESRGQDDLVVAAVCGALSDGTHRGGGLTDRTHTAVAFLPSVANPLTHRMHKGMNTTVDEGQTPIFTTGGVFDEATCFKPSHFTRGKDGKPSDVTPPLSADADKGDQDTVVCATGQRTHALTTLAACEEDGTGRGNPIVPCEAHAMRESGQGFWMKDEIAGTLRAEGENRPSRPSNVIAQPTSAVGFNWQNGGGYGKANDGLGITEEGTGPLQRCNTPAVAFTQNQREEVRILDVASACCAEPGSHQQTYIAQEAVAYVKATNPHSKEEAPRYEEAAVSACLNGWDERHDPPKHMVAACRHPATEALYTKGYSGGQQDACTQEADTGKALRVLRQEVGEKDFAQWGLGILDSFQRKEVLRSSLLGNGDRQKEDVAEPEAEREVVGGSSKGTNYLSERRLSEVRQAGRERRTPQGWKLSQQLSRELGAYLQELPHQGAQTEAALLDLWKASEGLRVLRDALPEVQEVGRSTSCERQSVHSGSQGYRSEREEEVRGSWVRSVGACEGPLRSPLDAEEARDARITAEDEKRDSQRNVGQSPLCVRRLVPSECEFLMGFPAGHTDIIFRKKPAADGPRYRALGNSMAVPCMFWLGHRIHQATNGDNA